MTVPILLMAALAARVTLVDEIVEVPAGRLHQTTLNLQQRAAILECAFETLSGGPGVGVAVVTADRRPMISLPARARGRFRLPASAPAAYVLVIDNRINGRHAARVRLNVDLDFEDPENAMIRTVPPARRAAVVAASLLFLAAVAVFAGRPLLRAALRRQDPG